MSNTLYHVINGALVPFTAEETAAQQAATQAAQTAQQRQAILAQLDDLDRRSIRALREGNQTRITQLEAEAAGLRTQLNQSGA